MLDYDLICIGGGHASWPIAVELQKNGKKALLITNDLLGGTCTTWGCDPKILLDAPFEIMAEAHRYRDIGLEGSLSMSWEKLQAYNREVIGPLAGMLKSLVESVGTKVISGHAILTGPNSVEVDGVEYRGNKIVVATGRRPAVLDIPGAEHIRDSSDFLYLEHMPEKIVFIGAGIISLEFASMAVKMAKEVVVLTNGDSALPQYYDRYTRKLVAQLEEEGTKFLFGETVKAIEKQDRTYRLSTSSGLVIETDYILGASGRVPNVQGLGLEAAGVEFNARGIPTDACLRTNVPSIYASGDVRDTNIPRLTPTAFFESAYLARHILGDEAPIKYPVVPHVAFTIPRVAQVGISQKQARGSNDYKVIDFEYGKHMLFQTRNESSAEMSFVFDRDGYLVGADLYADFAAELINFLTFIIAQRCTASDLRSMIFAFPAHSYMVVKQVLEGHLKQA